MTKDLASEPDHERVTRRGQQLFQLALRMEVGNVTANTGTGAEAILYLTDAIVRTAAIADEPRLALETTILLFDKISDRWFANNRAREGLAPVHQLFSHLAYETATGKQDASTDAEAAEATAAHVLASLTDAIIWVAALNSDPRQIIEHVVRRLDAADIDAARKEHLQ